MTTNDVYADRKRVNVCSLDFVPITHEEAWSMYLWGVGECAADYHVHEDAGKLVLFDRFPDSTDPLYGWACEVYTHGFAGDGYGATVAQAVARALVDSVGTDTLETLDPRERNAEDATNILAAAAYAFATGRDVLGEKQTPDVLETWDALLGAARAYVRAHGPAHGVEWYVF